MYHQPLRRAAFTLVEMAIVIVIIGLIVGGIMATRSYIRSAELATMMSETKFYMNALGQFQAQYKVLPGDMPNATNFWSGTYNGDGNGLISSGTVPNPMETILLPQHLALAGYIPGTFTGLGDGATLNATIGLNAPRGSIQNTTYLIFHMSGGDGIVSGSALWFDGLYANVLLAAAVNNPQTGGVPNTPFLTPMEASDVDRKFDDGLPGSGMILTPKSTALLNCATTDVVATALYNTAYTAGKSCYFIMKIQ